MRELKDVASQLGLDLDVIKFVTIITGTLVNEMPLRIGKGGGGLGEADLPVERTPSGIPYIPGSSLKGALRGVAERLVAGSGRHVCNIFTDVSECEAAVIILRKLLEGVSPQEAAEDLAERIRDKRVAPEVNELLDRARSVATAQDFLKWLSSKPLPCPVCRLFGNKELASHLLVGEALPRSKPIVEYRTRVAIDRFRRAARSGALFTYEYVPSGVEWGFMLKAYNIKLDGEDEASKLLRLILDYLKELGLEVGSMKSAGLGRLRLKEFKIKVYEVKDFRLVEAQGGDSA